MSKNANFVLCLFKQPDHQCVDMDSDCLLIEDHLHCWLHDRNKGHCPYLMPYGTNTFKVDK